MSTLLSQCLKPSSCHLKSFLVPDHSERDQRRQHAPRLPHLSHLHLEAVRLEEDRQETPEAGQDPDLSGKVHFYQAGGPGRHCTDPVGADQLGRAGPDSSGAGGPDGGQPTTSRSGKR